MNIHMLGIKGSGMSALALILKDLGHKVSGSDYEIEIFTQEALKDKGIPIYKFDKNNILNIDLLVVGHNFIDSNNVEIVEFRKTGKKILEYNECVSQIIEKYYSIAISGSNGKTTTTGLIASILESYENTSYLIGSGEGKANRESKYFTFEACEYKEHFLKYNPNMILVNNIDYDHVDYFKNKEDYKKAFLRFINNAKDKIIVNADDDNFKDLNNCICFGIECKKMFNARNISYTNGISYDFYYEDKFIKNFKINSYGKHMVYNTLAAITVTYSLGIDLDTIEKGIKNFKGVKRRFSETIINGDVYIDDYAHHPSKIKATIEAVKMKYPSKKIFAFYRPDRVTRLDYFSSEFSKSLEIASKSFILPYLKNGKEEKESIKRFLNENTKIELLTDQALKTVSEEKNSIYLMMSSKNVSEVKKKILEYKGD